MRMRRPVFVILIALAIASVGTPIAMAQMKVEDVEAPVGTEPGIFTLNGQYSRIAYNNEGWVTLGYRTANNSQGTQWMLLEAGVTIHKPQPNQTLTRASFSIKLPDGSSVPLATQKEYNEAGKLMALNRRGDTSRDSINYFPTAANQACPMLFFSNPSDSATALSYDQFELSWQRGCVGRLFFKLPEGKTIEPGQYWFRVAFAGSTVEAPFRILTKEEEKFLKKNWKDLKKQHEAYLKSEAEKAKQK